MSSENPSTPTHFIRNIVIEDLQSGKHDEIVTQWDMKGVEKVGLIKFDFLGLKTLTLLHRAVKMIEASHGEKIDLLHLPRHLI